MTTKMRNMKSQERDEKIKIRTTMTLISTSSFYDIISIIIDHSLVLFSPSIVHFHDRLEIVIVFSKG